MGKGFKEYLLEQRELKFKLHESENEEVDLLNDQPEVVSSDEEKED